MRSQPAIFLKHRATKDALVVGTWPTVQPVVKVSFDPDEFFKRLSDKSTEVVLTREELAIGSPTDESSVRQTFVSIRAAHPECPVTKSGSAGHLHQ